MAQFVMSCLRSLSRLSLLRNRVVSLTRPASHILRKEGRHRKFLALLFFLVVFLLLLTFVYFFRRKPLVFQTLSLSLTCPRHVGSTIVMLGVDEVVSPTRLLSLAVPWLHSDFYIFVVLLQPSPLLSIDSEPLRNLDSSRITIFSDPHRFLSDLPSLSSSEPEPGPWLLSLTYLWLFSQCDEPAIDRIYEVIYDETTTPPSSPSSLLPFLSIDPSSPVDEVVALHRDESNVGPLLLDPFLPFGRFAEKKLSFPLEDHAVCLSRPLSTPVIFDLSILSASPSFRRPHVSSVDFGTTMSFGSRSTDGKLTDVVALGKDLFVSILGGKGLTVWDREAFWLMVILPSVDLPFELRGFLAQKLLGVTNGRFGLFGGSLSFNNNRDDDTNSLVDDDYYYSNSVRNRYLRTIMDFSGSVDMNQLKGLIRSIAVDKDKTTLEFFDHWISTLNNLLLLPPLVYEKEKSHDECTAVSFIRPRLPSFSSLHSTTTTTPSCRLMKAYSAGVGTRSRVVVGAILGLAEAGGGVLYYRWIDDHSFPALFDEITHVQDDHPILHFIAPSNGVRVDIVPYDYTLKEIPECPFPSHETKNLNEEEDDKNERHTCSLSNAAGGFLCSKLGRSWSDEEFESCVTQDWKVETGDDPLCYMHGQPDGVSTYDFILGSDDWNEAYYVMFRPSNRVKEEVSQFLRDTAWFSRGAPVHGLHVRRGDHVDHLKKLGWHMTSNEEFENFIKKELKTNSRTRFYVATDGIGIVENWRKMFGEETILTWRAVEKETGEMHHRGTSGFHAAVDYYLLTLADKFMRSEWSSYSTHVERLRGAYRWRAGRDGIRVEELFCRSSIDNDQYWRLPQGIDEENEWHFPFDW